MRRYWLDQEALSGNEVRIQGDAFRHVVDVCRQGEGDRFEVLIGDGKAYLVEITEVSKGAAAAQILETRELEPLRAPYLHLVLSVPRFPVLEAVLEKAVELGVHTLHLVASQNSFLKKRSVIEQKWSRWERIVFGACRQSARAAPMSLEFHGSLQEILEKINPDEGRVGLFMYEGEGQIGLKEALLQMKGASPEHVYYFIGSEGGYSPEEVALFGSYGLPPVTLGSQVLRVETACVSMSAVLKYELERSAPGK